LTSKGDERIEADKLLQQIKDVDLLVLDELARETGGKEHIANEIETLLKERDMFNKPTIVISNADYKELVERYTSEFSLFSSAFLESYRALLFKPIDFRRERRKEWKL
jgi:DNA replication protein DnaC